MSKKSTTKAKKHLDIYDDKFLVPPKIDFVFKHIFGDERHKGHWLDF